MYLKKHCFDNFPIIEVGFKQSVGNYTLGNNKSEFVTNQPFLKADYDFLKSFIASFDYSTIHTKTNQCTSKTTMRLPMHLSFIKRRTAHGALN